MEGEHVSTGYNQQPTGYGYGTTDSRRGYNYSTLDSGMDSWREQNHQSSTLGFNHQRNGAVGDSRYEERDSNTSTEHSMGTPRLGQSAASPIGQDSPRMASPIALDSTPPTLTVNAPSGMSAGSHMSSSAMTLPTSTGRGLGVDGSSYKGGSSYQYHSTSNISNLNRGADGNISTRLRSASAMGDAGRGEGYMGEGMGRGRSAFQSNRSEGTQVERETSFINKSSRTNSHTSDFATDAGGIRL